MRKSSSNSTARRQKRVRVSSEREEALSSAEERVNAPERAPSLPQKAHQVFGATKEGAPHLESVQGVLHHRAPGEFLGRQGLGIRPPPGGRVLRRRMRLLQDVDVAECVHNSRRAPWLVRPYTNIGNSVGFAREICRWRAHRSSPMDLCAHGTAPNRRPRGRNKKNHYLCT